jgi:hypothetical protein
MMIQQVRWPTVLVAALLTVSPLGAQPARAQSARKVQGKVDFLNAPKRGKQILGYLHFGGKYFDHEVIKAFRVTDRSGQELAGHVALKVVFDWETSFGDNSTTAVFFFDEKGDPYEVQCNPSDTTSIISQPFALANGAIQVLGNLMLAAFGDQMTAQEKADAQRAIDKQDARQLLVDALKVQKRLGL